MNHLLNLLEDHKQTFTDKEYKDSIEELGEYRKNQTIYSRYKITFIENIISNTFVLDDDDNCDGITISNDIQSFTHYTELLLTNTIYEFIFNKLDIIRKCGRVYIDEDIYCKNDIDCYKSLFEIINKTSLNRGKILNEDDLNINIINESKIIFINIEPTN